MRNFQNFYSSLHNISVIKSSRTWWMCERVRASEKI